MLVESSHLEIVGTTSSQNEFLDCCVQAFPLRIEFPRFPCRKKEQDFIIIFYLSIEVW